MISEKNEVLEFLAERTVQMISDNPLDVAMTGFGRKQINAFESAEATRVASKVILDYTEQHVFL